MDKIKTFIFNDLAQVFIAFFLGSSICAIYINGYDYRSLWIFLGLAVFCIFTINIHAKAEVKRKRLGTHYSIFLLRLLAGVILSTALSYYIIPEISYERLKLILFLLAYFTAIFMVLFDILYNWHFGRRGVDLLYLGNQAWQDRIYSIIKNDNISQIVAFIVDVSALYVSIKLLNQML